MGYGLTGLVIIENSKNHIEKDSFIQLQNFRQEH